MWSENKQPQTFFFFCILHSTWAPQRTCLLHQVECEILKWKCTKRSYTASSGKQAFLSGRTPLFSVRACVRVIKTLRTLEATWPAQWVSSPQVERGSQWTHHLVHTWQNVKDKLGHWPWWKYCILFRPHASCQIWNQHSNGTELPNVLTLYMYQIDR